MLFEDNAGDLYYGLAFGENGFSEWMTRPVVRDASVGSGKSFGYVGGELYCVFYDKVNHSVCFASRPSS